MYSHLITCFPGWTWEYIDANMTLPRLREITQYQRDNPPIHIMIAAYLGIGTNKNKASETVNGESLFDILPRTPGT